MYCPFSLCTIKLNNFLKVAIINDYSFIKYRNKFYLFLSVFLEGKKKLKWQYISVHFLTHPTNYLKWFFWFFVCPRQFKKDSMFERKREHIDPIKMFYHCNCINKAWSKFSGWFQHPSCYPVFALVIKSLSNLSNKMCADK